MSKIRVVPNGLVLEKNENEKVTFFSTTENFYISMLKNKKESIIEFEKKDLIVFSNIFNALLDTESFNDELINLKVDNICNDIISLINKKDTI